MYRQVKIHPSQQDLLIIVWKTSVNSPLKTYRSTTVTYASPIVENDFYVDDVLSGVPDLETAIEIQQQLIGMMNACGMHLYKWCSNSCHPLSKVSTDDREYVVGNNDHTSVKALGLSWNPKKDCFHFTLNNKDVPSTFMKRTMLSFIAKLYDPLGLVCPIIVTAKVFMQKLWFLGLFWDAVVPEKEKSEFENFIRNLQNIEHLNIPRCIIQRNNTLVEIHGFSDSSEQAYGACVYVRCKDCFGYFSVHLLCSKSRVAPVKCVTLPRLELFGAVLLSKLVNKVLEAIQMTIDAVPLCTDSTIVLSWIRTQPHRLKCFVANRVIQITDLTSTFEWHHINSKEKPADPLSRGLSVDELNRNNIWFLQKLQKKNVDIFLTSRELNHARDALVRQAQTQEFNAELKALRLRNNIQPQNALIATLKRFFSRRGQGASIISDNATNFVKASKDLRKLHNLVMQPDEKVSTFLSTEGIYWKLNGIPVLRTDEMKN
ncbi:integrase catalytic domain-containing protein [Trichonephila clavipes]|nr:integrase catalytic domain-containing protein [Trichonephila clavipes]